MIISQDGPKIMQISNRTMDLAEHFNQLTETMYTNLRNSLGSPAETNKIWYGPRAQNCLKQALDKEQEFRGMVTSIRNLSNSIGNQASRWGNHERAI